MLLALICSPFHFAKAAEQNPISEAPIMQFPVISDIHIGGESDQVRFKNALTDLKIIAPNYNAIAMVGDLTNSGAVNEYDGFMKVLNANTNPDVERVITIGNHEYMEGNRTSMPLDEESYQQRFLDKTCMPETDGNVYYDKWIQGYHFIAMATEGYISKTDQDHAKISDEQFSWLEKKLAENSDPTKPIFVFLHQPINQTVYGSEGWWNIGPKSDRLFKLLKQYPQVILFSGHSHYILYHPRTVYQDGFTMVNTGSVSYGWTDLGYANTSQGLLVNVYPDRVEIKARDFINHSWIQTFTVKTPFEKTIGENQTPYFKQGSAVTMVKNTLGDSVTLSWDAAFDDSIIDKYLIKQNGKVLATIYTNYWDNRSATKVTGTVANLSPNTNYDLEITAVDAWNNESQNLLTTSFQTSNLNNWKLENENWFYYKDGIKVTGWQFINGKWYYFIPDGTMKTGWLKSGSKWYYLNDSGSMQVGWKDLKGKRYYFGTDGVLKTGWFLVQNVWYYADSDGYTKWGWLQDGRKWYYLKSDGMATGWLKVNSSTWYYFDSKGVMQTGWVLSSGKWYYMDGSGAMKTGWVSSGGNWYYLESSGVMKTGWLAYHNKWYYLNSNGVMQTGSAKINNVRYNFAPDGSLR